MNSDPRSAAQMDDDIAASRTALWTSALNSPHRDLLLPTEEEQRYAEQVRDGEREAG